MGWCARCFGPQFTSSYWRGDEGRFACCRGHQRFYIAPWDEYRRVQHHGSGQSQSGIRIAGSSCDKCVDSRRGLKVRPTCLGRHLDHRRWSFGNILQSRSRSRPNVSTASRSTAESKPEPIEFEKITDYRRKNRCSQHRSCWSLFRGGRSRAYGCFRIIASQHRRGWT
jgi:hypothetical protein